MPIGEVHNSFTIIKSYEKQSSGIFIKMLQVNKSVKLLSRSQLQDIRSGARREFLLGWSHRVSCIIPIRK